MKLDETLTRTVNQPLTPTEPSGLVCNLFWPFPITAVVLTTSTFFKPHTTFEKTAPTREQKTGWDRWRSGIGGIGDRSRVADSIPRSCMASYISCLQRQRHPQILGFFRGCHRRETWRISYTQAEYIEVCCISHAAQQLYMIVVQVIISCPPWWVLTSSNHPLPG